MKRFPLYLTILAILLTAGTLVGFLGIPGTGGGEPQNVSATAGKVIIPLADLNDGQAHFYRYSGGSTRIPFFIIKGKDGTLRAAFDACDVCYREKKGYSQKGEQMICKNCNQTFPVAKIGTVSGGCNPSPLKFTLSGSTVVFAASDLEEGARYFR